MREERWPEHRLQLTDRDRELIADILTSKVRTATVDQLARTLWSTAKLPGNAARARLLTLARHGYVLSERAPAHPELAFSKPQTTWQPGMRAPDFGAVSYRLQKRWSQHPVMTTVVAASRKSASFFGGHGGRLSREVERTHDIHLTRVYLLYRENNPRVLPFWTFEEELRSERGRSNEMLPDVLIREPGCTRAVECGGAYSREKLESFHRYCAERKIPYEIW